MFTSRTNRRWKTDGEWGLVDGNVETYYNDVVQSSDVASADGSTVLACMWCNKKQQTNSFQNKRRNKMKKHESHVSGLIVRSIILLNLDNLVINGRVAGADPQWG